MPRTDLKEATGVKGLFDLTDRVALVTGASRGLGKAMAIALAQAGADVALSARSSDRLKQVSNEIRKFGRKALVFPGDVSKETQVKQVVDAARKAFGKIDILINNAGVWGGSYFVRLTKEAWDRVVDVNMTGSFLVAKAVGRVMLKQRSGKIINIASILGMKGSPQAIAYCAAKGALIQMTRVMAIELAAAGVQVNAIAPGFFATDMTRGYIEDQPALKQYVARIPSGRYGQPQDLAGLVVFLASQASNHITGQTIVIDGGESLV